MEYLELPGYKLAELINNTSLTHLHIPPHMHTLYNESNWVTDDKPHLLYDRFFHNTVEQSTALFDNIYDSCHGDVIFQIQI